MLYLVLLSTALMFADDPPTKSVSSVDAIRKEQQLSDAEYQKATASLPDTTDGQKQAAVLWKAYDDARIKRMESALKLAKLEPDSELSFAAIAWILSNPRSYFLPIGKPSIELLTAHHAANPKIAKLITSLGYLIESDTMESFGIAGKLFRSVLLKNTDRTARGQAAMALAWQANNRFAAAELFHRNDVDQLALKAERAYEEVIKDYSDCPLLTGTP